MTHDTSGGVDGDVLLDWLLAHGFDCCGPRRCRWGSVCVGGCGQKGVEKGSGLGGGKGWWCGVGAGKWYCHVERMQVREEEVGRSGEVARESGSDARNLAMRVIYLSILSVPGRDWMYQWKNGWEKGWQSV